MRNLLISLVPLICVGCSSSASNPQLSTRAAARPIPETAAVDATFSSVRHGAIPGIDHVLIISIDGLRPDLLAAGGHAEHAPTF